MEWWGIDAPRKLPAVVNPRRGFIANWNNKPVPGWSAGEQRELWGGADRVQGLADPLEAARAAGSKLSVGDVKALMRHAAVFADELGVAGRAMYFPDVLAGDQEDDHGSFGTPDALFLRVLIGAGAVTGTPAPSGMRPPSRDYFADVTTGTPHTRSEVLADALRTALASLAARFGTSGQSAWQLPALRETYRDLGAIGPAFGPTEMERENRGSFNLAVDLGPPVRGEIIVPPGESGTFTGADLGHEPPHLRDQLALFEAFGYRSQPFAPGELEAPVTMESIPIIRP